MKVFKFNPETGQRGEQIDSVKRISWTDASVKYLIDSEQVEPVDLVLPKATKNERWIAHCDAGVTDKEGNFVSYLRDEWVCFCQGEVRYGQGPGVWEWIVLPPRGLLQDLV